jgi:hypothetical protein
MVEEKPELKQLKFTRLLEATLVSEGNVEGGSVAKPKTPPSRRGILRGIGPGERGRLEDRREKPIYDTEHGRLS